jgi:hypothetical protein
MLSSVDAVFVVVVVVVATFEVLLIVDPFEAAFEPLSAVAPELFEPSVEESDWSIATLAESLATTEPLSAVLLVELFELSIDEPLFAAPLSAKELSIEDPFAAEPLSAVTELSAVEPFTAAPLLPDADEASVVVVVVTVDVLVVVATLEPLLAEPLSATELFELSIDEPLFAPPLVADDESEADVDDDHELPLLAEPLSATELLVEPLAAPPFVALVEWDEESDALVVVAVFVAVFTELSIEEPFAAEPLSALTEASVVVVVVAVDSLDWFWTVWFPAPDSEFEPPDALLADAS